MLLFMVILLSYRGWLFKAGFELTLVIIQSSERTVLVSVFLHAFLFQNCKNMIFLKICYRDYTVFLNICSRKL